MGTNQPTKEEIERFSVTVPKEIYESFENIRKNIGISRSQAVRNAMHLFIENETQNIEDDSDKVDDSFILGTIYLLMKHASWGVTSDHHHEEEHHFGHGHHHHHEDNNEDHHGGIHSHGEKDEGGQTDEVNDNESVDEKMRYITVLESDILKNLEIQHEFHDIIISVSHIHAEHDICLEVLITKGKLSRIKALYAKLRKLRFAIDVRLFIALSKGN